MEVSVGSCFFHTVCDSVAFIDSHNNNNRKFPITKKRIIFKYTYCDANNCFIFYQYMVGNMLSNLKRHFKMQELAICHQNFTRELH